MCVGFVGDLTNKTTANNWVHFRMFFGSEQPSNKQDEEQNIFKPLPGGLTNKTPATAHRCQRQLKTETTHRSLKSSQVGGVGGVELCGFTVGGHMRLIIAKLVEARRGTGYGIRDTGSEALKNLSLMFKSVQVAGGGLGERMPDTMAPGMA